MTLTDDIALWTSERHCLKTVEALSRNGFAAVACGTALEARDYILKEATGAASVGFGGSRTIIDLEVEASLQAQGLEILNHAAPGLDPEQKLATMRRQLTCDLFLTSTNALTVDGHLVNIDGNGNRAAAMFFGPKKVIVVAGRNKLVHGGDEAALQRIRTWAAPANAHRLSRKTPCAVTGLCANCSSPERICRVTTVIARKPSFTDIHVVVVNEDLGL
nr:lactate utilization protein [uncultured Holophaga sp.]